MIVQNKYVNKQIKNEKEKKKEKKLQTTTTTHRTDKPITTTKQIKRRESRKNATNLALNRDK